MFWIDGTAVIHPKLQGINLLQQSKYPNEFLKQILKEKNGEINYLWQNPGEAKPREKIVIFRYLPKYKWIVASSSYVEEIFSPLRTFRNFLAVVLTMIILSFIGIAYVISASVTKPLTSLMNKLEEGAKGDFSVRMDDGAPDEFDKVSHHFNIFMDQLEKNHAKIGAEIQKNIEAIGTLAGGIAHDFNNILSGILGYAQLAEMNLDNSIKAKGHMAQIVKGAQRAAGLIQQILTFSRQTEYEKHPLSLYLVVKEALKLLRSSIPTSIEINEEIVSKARVLADPTQMHQVIMNLCTNAYHAMGETGGVLTVKLDEVDISNTRDVFEHGMNNGRYLELEIIDTGLGMDKKTLLKAFDPYFTTKEVGKGTGFGLALVHAIVEEHEGYIKVKSSVGQGSSFYVYLPVVKPEADHSANLKEEKSLQGGTEKIMVVDDEEDIRLVFQEFLIEYGYSVQTFENGLKAFETFEKDPEQFDLIATDMTMPQMTGDELAGKLLKIRQGIPIILCTGYSETISEAKILEISIRKYLQKPVSNKELAGLIREILDKDAQS